MSQGTEEKSRKGFASMDAERHRQISSKGGKAAQESGNAHHFTPEEATEAGRKGGLAISADTEHMAIIGRKGGQAKRGMKRTVRP